MSEATIDKPAFYKKDELPAHLKAEMTQQVLTGRQGMVVWSKINAGMYTAGHTHPNEQITWLISGRMDFRLGDQPVRTCVAGDLVLIPGGVEHEAWYTDDCDLIEFFTPPRVDLYPAAEHSAFGL
jgi:quercetin dioxygenase-like cupin family protein